MKSILLLLLLAMPLAYSKATQTTHMLSGSTNTDLSMTDPKNSDLEYSLQFTGSYAYAFNHWLQIGAEFGGLIQEGRDSYSLFTGPIFNYNKKRPGDLLNAFFLNPQIGLVHYTSMNFLNRSWDSKTKLGFGLKFGKRFKLFENVSYDPTIGVRAIEDDGLDANWTIEPIKFSIHF